LSKSKKAVKKQTAVVAIQLQAKADSVTMFKLVQVLMFAAPCAGVQVQSAQVSNAYQSEVALSPGIGDKEAKTATDPAKRQRRLRRYKNEVGGKWEVEGKPFSVDIGGKQTIVYPLKRDEREILVRYDSMKRLAPFGQHKMGTLKKNSPEKRVKIFNNWIAQYRKKKNIDDLTEDDINAIKVDMTKPKEEEFRKYVVENVSETDDFFANAAKYHHSDVPRERKTTIIKEERLNKVRQLEKKLNVEDKKIVKKLSGHQLHVLKKNKYDVQKTFDELNKLVKFTSRWFACGDYGEKHSQDWYYNFSTGKVIDISHHPKYNLEAATRVIDMACRSRTVWKTKDCFRNNAEPYYGNAGKYLPDQRRTNKSIDGETVMIFADHWKLKRSYVSFGKSAFTNHRVFEPQWISELRGEDLFKCYVSEKNTNSFTSTTVANSRMTYASRPTASAAQEEEMTAREKKIARQTARLDVGTLNDPDYKKPESISPRKGKQWNFGPEPNDVPISGYDHHSGFGSNGSGSTPSKNYRRHAAYDTSIGFRNDPERVNHVKVGYP